MSCYWLAWKENGPDFNWKKALSVEIKSVGEYIDIDMDSIPFGVWV